MPHNRFFVDQPLVKNTTLSLPEEEAHHIVKVMRLKQGDIFELINGQGYLAQASLLQVNKKTLICSIQEVIFQEKAARRFIIAQSFLKPSSLELLVEKNTELGMDELWLFPAFYSDKVTLSSHQEERLHKHLLAAIKQCGRLYLPSIRVFTNLEEICQESTGFSRFYGDTSPQALPLSHYLVQKPASCLFIVGPEQGFHEKELALFEKNSIQGTRLCPHILRAETASIAASVLLSHLIL
ncbi:MAG: 16S rRNA (uracil(1498)-N(3))-methyltransferase [Chlamydiae bacterium]|nr:16S rRNA (uracil(1498)-N(3))-methyltransferase [Chlamydiota bacterium]